jgi:hypothetical protein
MKKVPLLASQIDTLTRLPESGMGYQKVKLILRTGEEKCNMTVLNSEFLLIEDDQVLNPEEIQTLELEKAK